MLLVAFLFWFVALALARPQSQLFGHELVTLSSDANVAEQNAAEPVPAPVPAPVEPELQPVAAQESAPEPTIVPVKGLRILPMGDSITFGEGSSDGNGYRQKLLDKLVGAGDNVQFIGEVHAGNMGNNNNEGHPGQTINQILINSRKTFVQRPNVILLHAGTNDLNNNSPEEPAIGAPERLGAAMDEIFGACPDATVFAAKIIKDNDPDYIDYYNGALQGIVEPRLQKGMKVMLVDMSNIGVEASDLADGLHPNDVGYEDMAQVWAAAIQEANANGWITTPVEVAPPPEPVPQEPPTEAPPAEAPPQGVAPQVASPQEAAPPPPPQEPVAPEMAPPPQDIPAAESLPVESSSTSSAITTATPPPMETPNAEPAVEEPAPEPEAPPQEKPAPSEIVTSTMTSAPMTDAPAPTEAPAEASPASSTTTSESESPPQPAPAGETSALAEVPAVETPPPESPLQEIPAEETPAPEMAPSDVLLDMPSLTPTSDTSQTTATCDPSSLTWDAADPSEQITTGFGKPEDRVVLADLDGDGVDDYISINPAGDMTAYLNGGKNAARPGWLWRVQNGGKPIAVGLAAGKQVHLADIDGDGRADYLTVDPANGEVECFLNGGADGVAENGWSWIPRGKIANGIGGAAAPGIRFADVDGDGRADYVWVGNSGSAVMLLNRVFIEPANWVVVNGGKPIITGFGGIRDEVQMVDVTGDGRADYVWVRPDNGAVEVWENGGEDGSAEGTGWSWRSKGQVVSGIDQPEAEVTFARMGSPQKADLAMISQANGGLSVKYNSCNAVEAPPARLRRRVERWPSRRKVDRRWRA